jgi:hypothetical protein
LYQNHKDLCQNLLKLCQNPKRVITMTKIVPKFLNGYVNSGINCIKIVNWLCQY